jgi:hypothetical protein
VSSPPAFVSSSWKSLERRQRSDNSGLQSNDPSTDPNRRDPNGYETMITAL